MLTICFNLNRVPFDGCICENFRGIMMGSRTPAGYPPFPPKGGESSAGVYGGVGGRNPEKRQKKAKNDEKKKKKAKIWLPRCGKIFWMGSGQTTAGGGTHMPPPNWPSSCGMKPYRNFPAFWDILCVVK